MLPGHVTPREASDARCLRRVVAALLGLSLARCGGGGDEVRPWAVREPILGGAEVDTPDSPVLYLRSPEGGCSAILIAPRLVATARHCVASTVAGTFACTSAGELIFTGGGSGQIGSDDPPSALALYTSAAVGQGAAISGAPDAVGVQILSTQTSTACRDDLAFVVLDRPIPGLLPAPVRLDRPTEVGEMVSVWGYGLTDQLAPLALRARDGVRVAGVGPDVASTVTQLAPVRSVRTGPVTCQGDSGGPMVSAKTGALVALVSLGSQAGSMGPFCNEGAQIDTIGPRLAAFRDLAMSAFRAAEASPIEETLAPDAASPDAASIDGAAPPEGPDSASVADAEPEDDLASDDGASAGEVPLPPAPEGGGVSPRGPETFRVTGGACGIASGGQDSTLAALALALVWTAAAVGRRKR